MAYTKHTWVDDELITADKLNNIENGIETLANPLMASGELAEGDIISVQTADGKVKKFVYRKLELHPPLISSSSTHPNELPEIDSSVNKELLCSLLTRNSSIKVFLSTDGPKGTQSAMSRATAKVITTTEEPETTSKMEIIQVYYGMGNENMGSLVVEKISNRWGYYHRGSNVSIVVIISDLIPVEE